VLFRSSKEGLKPDTARLKGDALLAAGDTADALAYFERLAGTYAWAALGVAKVQTLLHDTKHAIGVLETLTAKAPLYVHATDLLAEAYIKDGQKEKALPLLEDACSKSPTVQRMRCVSEVAERLGDARVAALWAEKVVKSNRHAVSKDPLDYSRHIRNLVNSGQMDSAIATLATYEKEMPAFKTEHSVMAARAYMMATNIAQEEEKFSTLPDAIRERRLAHLQESKARLDNLLGELKSRPCEGQAAVYVAEALLAAGDERGCEVAALAAADGAYLPKDMPSRATAIAKLIENYKHQSLDGLRMIKAGQYREALRHFMALSEKAPVEMAPQLLANVILAVVSMHKQRDSTAEELPIAKAAYQRMKRQYPNYERLESVEKAFLPLVETS
jgi:tetratricopeptide (TPR) repeat protein